MNAIFITSLLLLGSDAAAGPLPADKAAQAMVVPDGFKVTLFAAEPDVVQPVSFCLDDRGRLFVAEALNYGTWRPTGKDRIIILEDTDGDGRADSRKVFYEGLNYITGIEVGFGGVWVMSTPKLYFIPDRDGDDRPDGEPEVVFDGFGHKESRHNLPNGFTWGPDGWLYAGHGRTSPSDVGRPGTAAEQRIHCDGGVYRIHPTRLVFENFADGTTNPWGVDFDDFGACFVSNCVNPHLFHMIQGGHYEPWRNRPSSLYAYERLPTCADHLHFQGAWNMRGDSRETLALGGGHAHCGTLVYLGDNFPPHYRNDVFMCNIHGRRINHDRLLRKGSGYTASHAADFMLSGDPWFMGVTLQTGPDGSVFVSDWSDTGECHTYKPNTQSGRIYRISYGDVKPARVDLRTASDAQLVKMQLHANDWYVRHARRLLQERAARNGANSLEVLQGLRDILERHPETTRRLRALWALHASGGMSARDLERLLLDAEGHIRAWVVQLLCEKEPSAAAVDRLAVLARGDPSRVVRLYLAAALQRLPFKDRWGIAEGLLSHRGDETDANLPLMTWYGVEPLVPADPGRALRLAAAAELPLVRQFIARRFVDDQLTRTPPVLERLLDAVAAASEPVQVDLLRGALEALRGRKSLPLPENWPALYARLARVDAVREHALTLALIFGDPQAVQDLRATARAADRPGDERRAALERLIEHHVAGLGPLLLELLGDSTVRRAAIRGLASYPGAEVAPLLVARYSALSGDEKQDAIATLAARKEYAAVLLDALEQKKIPRGDVSAYAARQLHALGDPKLRQRLREQWGEVRDSAPDRQRQLARYKALLTPATLAGADLSNGRLVFNKSCAQCHVLYGEGGKIGPDLTGSNRSNLDYLLSNLIDPSAEIGQDYRMSIVTTRDGRVLTGLIVERSPSRLTLQTATERLVLAPDAIESIGSSPLSIMPEGQLETLARDQVRDLIAYLAGKAQVPLPRAGQ